VQHQTLMSRPEINTYDSVDFAFQNQSIGSTSPFLPGPHFQLIDLTEDPTHLDIFPLLRERYPTLLQCEIISIQQRFKDIPLEDRKRVEDIYRFPMRNRTDFVTKFFGGLYKEQFVSLRDNTWINGEVNNK